MTSDLDKLPAVYVPVYFQRNCIGCTNYFHFEKTTKDTNLEGVFYVNFINRHGSFQTPITIQHAKHVVSFVLYNWEVPILELNPQKSVQLSAMFEVMRQLPRMWQYINTQHVFEIDMPGDFL